MELLHILMVLALTVLGNPNANTGMPSDLKPLTPKNAPVYAQLDIAKFRQFAANHPQISKAVFAGKGRTEAIEQALGFYRSELGLDGNLIRDTLSGITGIAFSLTGFGRDDRHFRPLLILDRGESAPVLEQITAPFTDTPNLFSYKYAGAEIYRFAERNEGVWVTEVDGKIALTIDPVTMHNFILRLRNTKPTPAPYSDKIFLAELNPSLLQNVMSTLSRWDYKDFFIFDSMVDFAGWKKMELSFTQRGHIDLSLKLDKHSPITKVVSQHSYTMLVNQISRNTGFAFTLGVKDANVIWQHIRHVISGADAYRGRQQNSHKRASEEFQREFGLDLKQDFLDNVVGLSWIVPEFKRERDLERKMVVSFEVKDDNVAKATIEKMVAYVQSNHNAKFTTNSSDYVTTWSSDRLHIAHTYKTISFISTKLDLQKTLELLKGDSTHYGEHLRKVNGGDNFLVWNYSQMLPRKQDFEPLVIGARYDDRESTVHLRCNVKVDEMVRLVVETIKNERRYYDDKTTAEEAVETMPVEPPEPVKPPDDWKKDK